MYFITKINIFCLFTFCFYFPINISSSFIPFSWPPHDALLLHSFNPDIHGPPIYISKPRHTKLQWHWKLLPPPRLDMSIRQGECVPKAGNTTRDSPHFPHLESHMETKLHRCNICGKDLDQSHAGSRVAINMVLARIYWKKNLTRSHI